ncbi:MAG: protein kinase [Solirubrobacterales bacterium]
MGANWDIDRIIDELAGIYAKSDTRKIAWPKEKDGVKDALVCLDKAQDRYIDATALGVGGLGIVLKCKDKGLGNRACALKFPRPKPESQDLYAEMISKEIARLSEVRHSGIVGIHSAGSVGSRDGAPTPFYVMDLVTGRDSQTYLERRQDKDLAEVIRRTADAIEALHSADLVHLDLKPDNVMIDEAGRPVIMDLGTTKGVHPGDRGETRVGVTSAYAPRELLSFMTSKSESDPDNYSGAITRGKIRKEWDIICFGKTILAWLGYEIDSGVPSKLSFQVDPYVRKYLLLMAARMLGSSDGYDWLWKQINLEPKIVDTLQIETIEEVIECIEKLSGRRDLMQDVPELDPYSPNRIQIGPQGPATLTPRVKELLEHSLVRRLGSITQLGIVSQVYPTATHSRLEHSLGTYANTCRLVRSLYNDPYSPFFRQVMTAEDLAAILALSLLHDTGQFPHAHDLEEIDSSLFDHKRLTRAVLQGGRNTKSAGFRPLQLPSIKRQLESWQLSEERLVQLLEVRLDRTVSEIKDRILHSIIDGAIDGDKLDYLARDSSRLGVPYGQAVDDERIASSVTVIVTKNNSGKSVACIGVHEKARVAAESLAVARSEMYSQVYWHHTVRSMKAMLARAVQRLAVHLADSNSKRNQFVSEFEHFSMSLPEALTPGVPQLFVPPEDDNAELQREALPIAAAELGGLAATDAAVLAYLEEYMKKENVKDHELLRSIRTRVLFKRLHVWSLGGENKLGLELAEKWDGLNNRQKLEAYEQMEREISQRVGLAAGSRPETITLNPTTVKAVETRVQSRLPVILVDLPNSKPGSEIPLYYVLETERRALRRDGSSVGRAHASTTWEQYGEKLREQAGKLRVFCHASAAEPIEAAVDRETFAQVFEEACTSAAGS